MLASALPLRDRAEPLRTQLELEAVEPLPCTKELVADFLLRHGAERASEMELREERTVRRRVAVQPPNGSDELRKSRPPDRGWSRRRPDDLPQLPRAPVVRLGFAKEVGLLGRGKPAHGGDVRRRQVPPLRDRTEREQDRLDGDASRQARGAEAGVPEALRQPAERDVLPAVRVPDGDVTAVDVFEDDPSARLRWSDIDFDGAKIALLRTKTGSADWIDMHPAVAAELNRL